MPKSLFFVCKLINALKQQSSTFLAPETGGRQFFHGPGNGGWFLDDSSALYLLCTFRYYIISSISNHQALDLGGWGPLLWRARYFFCLFLPVPDKSLKSRSKTVTTFCFVAPGCFGGSGHLWHTDRSRAVVWSFRCTKPITEKLDLCCFKEMLTI